MYRLSSWLNKNILNLFLIFFVVLNIAPILAPLLLHFEIYLPAKIIYTVYSFFCHQQHWKSLHLFDNQYAWCTRDVFIWGSMLFMLLLVKKKKLQPLTFYLLVLYSIPMALDGGLQTLGALLGYRSADPFYTSNNFFRMLTGTLFGGAMGLFLFPRLREIADEDNEGVNRNEIEKGIPVSTHKIKTKLTPTYWRLLSSLLILMSVVYIVLIQFWALTSNSYLPTNFLDSEIKIPTNRQDWFDRRKHGI